MKTPFLVRSSLTVFIKLDKSGMWQITFEAHITSVFLIYALTVLLSSKGEWLRNQSNWKHFLIYSTLILLFYLIWPIEESRIVALALGYLIIGFWLGQKIDEKYFSFKSPEKLLIKMLSATIALVGFIQINNFRGSLYINFSFRCHFH